MSTVPNFLDFNINAVLRPTFIRKLCYKLPSIVTLTFIQIICQNCAFFTEWHQSCRVCLIQCQIHVMCAGSVQLYCDIDRDCYSLFLEI